MNSENSPIIFACTSREHFQWENNLQTLILVINLLQIITDYLLNWMQSMLSCIISSICNHRGFVVPTCKKKCQSRKEQPSSNWFISSHCWFLCGSSNDSFLATGSCVAATRFFSYCWFLCNNNKVSLFLYAWSVGLVRCWVGIWSGCARMMKC